MLLHDKHQPGASCDKTLIQKIPPSFAENPNEDLKYSAGRRPGGCGYTLPLLALPVIVSLSSYWLSLAGDERDMTAQPAYVHRPHTCMAPQGSCISWSTTNIQDNIKKTVENFNKKQIKEKLNLLKLCRTKQTCQTFSLNTSGANLDIEQKNNANNANSFFMKQIQRNYFIFIKR